VSEVPRRLLELGVAKSERGSKQSRLGPVKQEGGERVGIDTENARLVGSNFEKVSSLPADGRLNGLCGVLAATLWWQRACSPCALAGRTCSSAVFAYDLRLHVPTDAVSGALPRSRTPRILSYPDVGSSGITFALSGTYLSDVHAVCWIITDTQYLLSTKGDVPPAVRPPSHP
jgi:hypothetical protein